MGVSIDSGGGGKRPLNAELNLVPFIDLLVCCICFLLITAVWTQMARIEVNQRGRSSMSKPTEEKLPEVQVKITVLVGEDGYTLTAGGSRVPILKQGQAYNTELLAKHLRDLKVEHRDKNDLTVAVEDDIPYKYIVQAMDVALQESFTSIRLADASAPAM